MFSHVGRLSLSGCDEIAEAARMRETGIRPAEGRTREENRAAFQVED